MEITMILALELVLALVPVLGLVPVLVLVLVPVLGLLRLPPLQRRNARSPIRRGLPSENIRFGTDGAQQGITFRTLAGSGLPVPVVRTSVTTP